MLLGQNFSFLFCYPITNKLITQKFANIIFFYLKKMNQLKIPKNLETISLDEQINYRLMEIGKVKHYFDQEIKYQ